MPQLPALTQLIISPAELDNQALLSIADSCFNLHRLVFVDDRYSEHVCRQAAEARKVTVVSRGVARIFLRFFVEGGIKLLNSRSDVIFTP